MGVQSTNVGSRRNDNDNLEYRCSVTLHKIVGDTSRTYSMHDHVLGMWQSLAHWVISICFDAPPLYSSPTPSPPCTYGSESNAEEFCDLYVVGQVETLYLDNTTANAYTEDQMDDADTSALAFYVWAGVFFALPILAVLGLVWYCKLGGQRMIESKAEAKRVADRERAAAKRAEDARRVENERRQREEDRIMEEQRQKEMEQAYNPYSQGQKIAGDDVYYNPIGP
ncbi:hypothetical protein KIPB_002104 [Kipferlia bialata]|uniref:Uncharacterized protein n=1 Tax=Kipferlia bialata TaxID=797122 RepID=A0A9K3CRA5_9EUKA|nr:hypothetical protein KIPB_002104 [Kipferlia bialata]|eukprot:g2104.t1